MASKINKNGLSQTTIGKSTPTSLKSAAKPTRLAAKSEPNTPSPTPLSKVSVDRFSSNFKSSTEKKSTPPEKTQTRIAKGSESQPRLIQIKEDLRKANEAIALLENEKAKTFDELKEARKEAEDASTKLVEVLKAHKKAEENFEIEKFEAVEAGIEAVQRREEKFTKEVERLKHQHALDSASLRLELEKAKQELVVANDVKSKAMCRADDASKMSAIHSEKVEILSSELIRLKALLDSTREKETITNKEVASKLGAEIVDLKRELENAKSFEAEVKERDMIIEKLRVDLEAAKMAESYAHNSANEWQNKAEEFEELLEEANELKRSASVSLASTTKQLQETNDRLRNMECEITGLKEKNRLLEATVAKQKKDLEESQHRLVTAEEEVSKIEKEAEEMKNELETLNEEKARVLKKEQEATSSVQRLLEERIKILSELERSKEEEEKSKKAMESLTSALHEVMSESPRDKEYETQIDDLKLVIETTKEKYEEMLAEARHEIDVLVGAVEQTKLQFENSMVDWETREAGLVTQLKKFDEEVFVMEKEMNRLSGLLKRKKEEADAAWKKESEMRDSLKEVEDEVIYLQETLREATVESLKLKEKETEFQRVMDENDELKAKQDDSAKKIEELSKLLEEALAKKHTEENGEVTESEKDNNLLAKVVEFSEANGRRSVEENSCEVEVLMNKILEVNTKKNEKKEDSQEDDTERESAKEEEKSNMVDESEKASLENMEEKVNVLIGEDEIVKEKEEVKKKKTLFGKVGNLLKKKGSK